ncbi:alpha-amylase family protein [Paenibacillus agricola]|uniref:Family 10 glycosylhydrolase n=1 Tax=Paenibacillus agricola TaxID=2716264 RepID=A0ABX0IYH0_9BACL|nr:alpha-amylase family protein [Paenibacillus agricola]NHN29009.1 family 10 glycosylhydrolase [Paenibacillus agricola]
MKWWQQKPMRLIQTNLREIDARLDVDEFVKSLKEYAADVVLVNTGGIVASYPSELDFHFRNPCLVNDFVGEVISKVHEAGIRYIARFDFSRLNEAIALGHPDWLYQGVKGETVNYNGQVHTSFNGWYQQEGSIQILTEAVRKYPIDGVFINMHGYVTHDYSYNFFGICQSAADQVRFKQMFGHDKLPTVADSQDPVYLDYEKFKQQTVAELFRRRAQAVKAINEHVAICNYTPEGTDIFRMESNTGIDRGLPEFNYSASHNVKLVHGSWEGMAVSNSAVHFVDFAMRHAAVSPHMTQLRLAQDLVQGAWLDYYVIGTLTNQDDRLCMDSVKDIYSFHKQNEHYYTNIRSIADVCLIEPYSSAVYGSMSEFKGMFRMLSELHIAFDVVRDHVLEDPEWLAKLSKYQAVIIPDGRNLDQAACQLIDAYVKAGGKLLTTGATSTCDKKGTPLGKFQLECVGVASIKQAFPKQQGTYFAVTAEDKVALKGFDAVDVVYLYGEYLLCEAKPDSQAYLGYIPPCMFGPPEKCYITEVTNEPGLIYYRYGQGETAVIPWTIGRHYEKLSNHGHAMLLKTVLEDLLGISSSIKVINGSPLVEVSAHHQLNGAYDLVHTVNLSGQLGTAFHAPLSIRDLRISFTVKQQPQRIFGLRSGKELPIIENTAEQVTFLIPELDVFETVVISY